MPAFMPRILKRFPLAEGAQFGPWPTFDPFLFCVHHVDLYPKGDGRLGVERALLSGRDLGQDFAGKDGFRMYHGKRVPGFPSHPHRGFETVTIARRGLIDHSDSLGAAARFGEGDVQWLTAGAGIQHSEMFPLLSTTSPNPAELFQIWLNLPAAKKMVRPYFSMLWSETVPRLEEDGASVAVIAGSLAGRTPPSPPPDSWGSDPRSELGIWAIQLVRGGRLVLPATASEALRTLYVFAGDELGVNGERIEGRTGLVLSSDAETHLHAEGPVEVLVLQGRPIGEPIAQYGPFVMNTRAEIQQAFADYQRTQFGGWPWPASDPDHGPTRGRFARHADGRVEERGGGA